MLAISKPLETIKVGRRKVGALYESDDGPVFLAYRWVSDIQIGLGRDIASAVRAGDAMWAIENEVLGKLRRQEIKTIGVVVRDTGERYLAKTESWFDHEKVKTIGVRGRSGSFKALPFSAFERTLGKIPKIR